VGVVLCKKKVQKTHSQERTESVCNVRLLYIAVVKLREKKVRCYL